MSAANEDAAALPPSCRCPDAAEMAAAGARGLRASYHRLMDKVELLLPEKLRPLYNHPAGNDSWAARTQVVPLPPKLAH